MTRDVGQCGAIMGFNVRRVADRWRLTESTAIYPCIDIRRFRLQPSRLRHGSFAVICRQYKNIIKVSVGIQIKASLKSPIARIIDIANGILAMGKRADHDVVGVKVSGILTGRTKWRKFKKCAPKCKKYENLHSTRGVYHPKIEKFGKRVTFGK